MSTSSSTSGRDLEMMHVRTAAQVAQGEAAAAAMARSADETIEERARQRAVESAREVKALKRDAMERHRWSTSEDAYKKVSVGDISSSRSDDGSVRVERHVPDAFVLSLIEEERRLAEREAASASRSEPATEPRHAATTPSPNPPSGQRDGSRVVPQISGAALVDGSAAVNHRESAPASPGAQSQAQGSAHARNSDPEELPGREEEEPSRGLFSLLRPGGGGESRSRSSGGGFLGLGRRSSQPASDPYSVDASLFPTGSTEQSPTGGSLGVDRSANEFARADESSTGEIELPGQAEETPRRAGLSLPRPNLSLPNLASAGGGSREPSAGALTTVNSAGNEFYVVSSTAQFMVYGEDRMQSEVRALPAGTLVRMTKPGEQWASVRTPDGSEGIVQNAHLRAATSAEAGTQFAANN